MDFQLGFDPQSLVAMTNLLGFKALLEPEIQQALTSSGEVLVSTAQANTWQIFAYPTGVLADSIYFWVSGPDQISLGVGVDYGRRRELGFMGMTDSLGRGPYNDPAKPYLQPALDSNQDLILRRIEAGVELAWQRIGGE